MTLHAFVELLKYKRKAFGRHGIHSPFVYDFIERVVMDAEIIPREYIVSYPSLPLRFENILSRIAAHYKLHTVARLPAQEITTAVDMVLLDAAAAKQWPALLEKYIPFLTDKSMVIAVGIHTSKEHSASWNALCNDAAVRMSIDMYGIGLLLFRQEFKERQHFVLRY